MPDLISFLDLLSERCVEANQISLVYRKRPCEYVYHDYTTVRASLVRKQGWNKSFENHVKEP